MSIATAKDVRVEDWQPEHLFWRHVAKGAPAECWNWTGFIEKDGYGYAMRRNRFFYVHRVSYALAGYTIEAGQVIDHLCRNRACVNPAHLEATSPLMNFQRGETHARRNNRCVNGHDIAVVGEHARATRPTCAQCGRDRVRRYKARLRAAVMGETA